MATTKKETAIPEEEKVIEPYSPEDVVELPPLFKDDDRYSRDEFVCVNGMSYQIPRGVSGLVVPRVVKEVLDQSEKQKQTAYAYSSSIEGIKNQGEYKR